LNKKFLWVEEYRPRKVEDCILPPSLKKSFQEFVDAGEFPSLLLSGTAGVGKTSIARALCDELGVSTIVINGSDEGRYLDTVRTRVKNFASSVSLSGSKHKCVILDEADNMTPDVQSSLRAAIEEYQNNCRFIFTCNYKNKIISPLQSRCSNFDFTLKKSDALELQGQFFLRVKKILKENGVTAEDKVLVKLIQKHYPDWRRCLNELQRHAASGEIDSGILTDVGELDVSQLVKALKGKEFNTVRQWVVENLDNEPNIILRKVYDVLSTVLVGQSVPQLVLIIAEYQYKSSFVADQEINLLACMTQIMVECQFK
jgi:DNA polymerase III delta prime subunit|tara:strand:- start:331 stop:1272 length:942 start_codon:yes stop_codon:yes gene_type:complete